MKNGTMCFLRVNDLTLLIYRDKGEVDMHNGWYVPPGGETERGERGLDCIIREFKEETGLALLDPKLKVIATFYNQGRVLGGKEWNPEDWCVEVYKAKNFRGTLSGGEPGARTYWIPNSDLANIKRIYPGDRKILELLDKRGVYEAIIQYDKEELVRFEYQRVF